MKHTVHVTVSGTWFGIQSLQITVDFGYHEKVDISELQKTIMQECAMRGYTAVLGYKKIDDEADAAMIFNRALADKPLLAREVVRHLDHIASCVNEIADMERRIEEGDPWAVEHGKDRIAFLKSAKREHQQFIWNAHKALELIGVDVDDRDTTRRICTNLGLYRTNL